ncbi:MAG: tyrosine-type recombinase/integrase [Frankiales bacterium]|nr:tyrosine-type recombinase/integrase [Frankiales bacterium]
MERGKRIVEEWLRWLEAGDTSPGTVVLRRSQLIRLAARVPLLDADEDDLVAWLATVGWSTETRRSARAAVRGFYRWAHRAGYIDSDPSLWLRPIRPASPRPRPIPEPALAEALLRADRERTLMLLLGAYAGLRRAEIARVHGTDVEGPTLVVRGKGRRVRRVPIHVRLEPHLTHLEGWAFPSPRRPGFPVGETYIRDRLGEVLPEPWTPHSLRHRFATQAYRVGRDLVAVQMLLGHARIETTRLYVAIEDETLADTVRAVA